MKIMHILCITILYNEFIQNIRYIIATQSVSRAVVTTVPIKQLFEVSMNYLLCNYIILKVPKQLLQNNKVLKL